MTDSPLCQEFLIMHHMKTGIALSGHGKPVKAHSQGRTDGGCRGGGGGVGRGKEDEGREEKHEGELRSRLTVPALGGPGTRTQDGHLIKNQFYYNEINGGPDGRGGIPIWSSLTHVGTSNWKYYHGMEQCNDMRLFEALASLEKVQQQWMEKRDFVEATREETLRRFQEQQEVNTQLSKSASWAPHYRARKEIMPHGGSAWSDLNCLPVKRLKQVITSSVEAKDRTAVESTKQAVSNEFRWEDMYKDFKQRRMKAIKHNFERRQFYNDTVHAAACQPDRPRLNIHTRHSLSQRTLQLAEPKPRFKVDDVTKLPDFRGYITVDDKRAMQFLRGSRKPKLTRRATGGMSTAFLREVEQTDGSQAPIPHQQRDQLKPHIKKVYERIPTLTNLNYVVRAPDAQETRRRANQRLSVKAVDLSPSSSPNRGLSPAKTPVSPLSNKSVAGGSFTPGGHLRRSSDMPLVPADGLVSAAAKKEAGISIGGGSSSKKYLADCGAASSKLGFYEGDLNRRTVCGSLDNFESQKALFLLATGFRPKGSGKAIGAVDPRRMMIGMTGTADFIALPKRHTVPREGSPGKEQ